jgi:hypothetical protein
MHGKATKLSYEIGMGPEVEQHGSRPDDTTGFRILSNENEGIIGEDGALQPEFIVEFAMWIVGTIHGEKDLANLSYILFAGFSDSDHDRPVAMDQTDAAFFSSCWPAILAMA